MRANVMVDFLVMIHNSSEDFLSQNYFEFKKVSKLGWENLVRNVYGKDQTDQTNKAKKYFLILKVIK